MEEKLKKQGEIFKSNFFLEFSNEQIEKEFSKGLSENARKKNLWICSLALLLSTILIGLVSQHRENEEAVSMMISHSLEMVLFILNFCLHICLFVLILVTKSSKNQEILFNILYVLKACNYIFMGEILHMYTLEHDIYLIYFILVQFFIRLGLIIWTRKFRPVFIGTIGLITVMWVLILTLKSEYQRIYMIYHSGISVLYIFLCIFSYVFELNLRNSFYVKFTMNFERNFLFSVINNIRQGFLIIKDGRLIFINKYFRNMLEKEEFYFGKNGTYERNDTDEVFQSNRNYLIFNNDNMAGGQFNSKIEGDNNYNEILAFIFSKLNYLNPELTLEFQNFIKSAKENKNLFNSNELHNNTLNEIYNTFTYLGKFQLGTDKEYEVLFRKYLYDLNKDNYHIEFIINDITDIVQKERRNTIINCRSLYMNKIAHEFRNPLCNMIELVNTCEENENYLAKEGKNENKEKLFSSLKNICDMLLYLLKDFSYFSNYDLSNELSSPPPNKYNFNPKNEILSLVKIFKNKIRMDNKNSNLDFKISYENLNENEEILIESNKQIFNSLIFNLLYQAYKSTIAGKIIIKISKEEVFHKSKARLYFSVTHGGAFVNSVFDVYNNLKNNLENLKQEFKNENIDEFNQNFQILISHLYSKKLGTDLKIELRERAEISYTFALDQSLEHMIVRRKLMNGSCKFLPVNDKISLHKKEEFSPIIKKHNKVGSSPLVKMDILKSEEGTVTSKSIMNTTVNKDVLLIMPEGLRGQTNLLNDSNYSLYSQFIVNDDNMADLKSEPKDNLEIQIISQMSVSQDVSLQIKEAAFDLNNHSVNNHPFENITDSIKFSEIYFNSTTNRSCFNKNKKSYMILVIDDEKLIRKTLQRFFTRLADEYNLTIEILQAENCFEAIDLIYKNYLQQKFIDAIFIDETMPIMRGSMLISMLNELNKEHLFYKIKIASFTSYDTPEKKTFLIAKGADWVLNKPLSYQDFKIFSEANILE
jgi:CheY-like chemotaxis protein/signal transduction histidine kinase